MMRKYTSIHLTDETYQTSLILYCCQMSMQAPFTIKLQAFGFLSPGGTKALGCMQELGGLFSI